MDYCKSLKELLLLNFKKYPNHIAFKYKLNNDFIDISYNDFVSDVQKAASYLKTNLSDHKHIAIAADNSYSWIVMFFAITVIGKVAVLPYKILSFDEFCYEIICSDATALLCDKEILDNKFEVFKKCKNLVYCENIESWREYSQCNLPNKDIDPSTPAAILFTSGTTDNPKPVLLSHENLAANSTCDDLGIKFEYSCASILTYNHVFSLSIGILHSYYCGCCHVVCDNQSDYLAYLKDYNINFTLMVPSMVETFTKMIKAQNNININDASTKFFGKNLSVIAVGGAYIDSKYCDFYKKCGITLALGYGLTETSAIIATNVANLVFPGTVGKVQSISKVRICDGEIQVKGKNVMLGYYKMPDETKKVIEDGWFKTGDLGYFDDNKNLCISGRLKDVIIASNGENVSPEQIESKLTTYNNIKSAHAYLQKNKICVDVELIDTSNLNRAKLDVENIRRNYNKSQPGFKKIYEINILQSNKL